MVDLPVRDCIFLDLVRRGTDMPETVMLPGNGVDKYLSSELAPTTNDRYGFVEMDTRMLYNVLRMDDRIPKWNDIRDDTIDT
jgi:hypothetical protein